MNKIVIINNYNCCCSNTKQGSEYTRKKDRKAIPLFNTDSLVASEEYGFMGKVTFPVMIGLGGYAGAIGVGTIGGVLGLAVLGASVAFLVAPTNRVVRDISHLEDVSDNTHGHHWTYENEKTTRRATSQPSRLALTEPQAKPYSVTQSKDNLLLIEALGKIEQNIALLSNNNRPISIELKLHEQIRSRLISQDDVIDVSPLSKQLSYR